MNPSARIHLLSAGLLAAAALAAENPPSLKDAFSAHFPVGTAINRSQATGAGGRRNAEQVAQEVALVKRQFNQVTAENDMKWQLIHPREGADGYDFGPADSFVNFGLSNRMEVVGHTLVWHNDYGLENPVKIQKLVTLIRSLQEQKVPIHVIGTQAHLNVSTAGFDQMDGSLNELAKLGLPIHVTELDINSAQGGQRGTDADVAANAATTQGGLVSDADRKLADAYAGVFRAFLKHHGAVKMVTFWGVNDAVSWRANGKPLLFDGDNQPKAAFDAVIAEAKKAAEAR